MGSWPSCCNRFQSTPPAEAEGDILRNLKTFRTGGFNPLPPPKRRETIYVPRRPFLNLVSIHSPRRSGGRHLLITWA